MDTVNLLDKRTTLWRFTVRGWISINLKSIPITQLTHVTHPQRLVNTTLRDSGGWRHKCSPLSSFSHFIHTPFCSCAVSGVKINVTAEPYCALPPLSISFIHRRVIGSQFELPLCLLWANFALTECGRLMATSSQGRLASASMSALNSLHQFPPVLHSPSSTHKRERKGGDKYESGLKQNSHMVNDWKGQETKE